MWLNATFPWSAPQKQCLCPVVEPYRVWSYGFKFPSRSGCSTLVPTTGKDESAHWALQQPALNIHGVWHTPQPWLCLCWVQCLCAESPVRTTCWLFFHVASSRHCLVQLRSDTLNQRDTILGELITLFPTLIAWYSSHLSWREVTHMQMLGNPTHGWPMCCSTLMTSSILLQLPPKEIYQSSSL